MLNLNYELLKLFQVVMSEPTLKGSAERLGVTPSAVSQSLKKLEDELGVQLFLREHKKLILSPQGKALKEKLIPMLGQIEGALNEVISQNQANEISGTLTIGSPSELGSTFLVRELATFQKKHPNIKARLKFGSPLQLLEMISEGEIDFALSADGIHFKNLNSRYSRKKLFDEELVVIAPSVWRVKNDFQALIELPHLDYADDGSAIGMWYQQHFKKVPKNLDVVLVAENAMSLTEAVKAGLGVAMVPLQRVQDYLDDSVVMVNPTKNKFLNPIVLIQHMDKVPTMAEKKFIEALSN